MREGNIQFNKWNHTHEGKSIDNQIRKLNQQQSRSQGQRSTHEKGQ